MTLTGLYDPRWKPSTAQCGFVASRGNRLLVAPLPTCGNEPPEFVLTTSAATALNGGAITAFIKTVNGAAAVTGDSVFFSKGRLLKWGSAFYRVAKSVEVKTIISPGTTIEIDPAPAAITTTTDSAIFYPTAEIFGVQSLTPTFSDVTEDNGELEDFYQSTITLGRSIQIAVSFKQRELNLAYQNIIYPAIADPGKSIFAALYSVDEPTMWGVFKVADPTSPKEKSTAAMHSFNLNSQDEMSVPLVYPSKMDVGTKAIYDSLLERIGVSTALTNYL